MNPLPATSAPARSGHARPPVPASPSTRVPAGRRLLTRVAVALTWALPTVMACGGPGAPDPDAWAGTPLPGEVQMPSRTLPRVTGPDAPQPFALDAAGAARVTLLFIGYTYCPDVCPVHLANLGAVLRDLPLRTTREIRTLFVTADPARDTPERLASWLDALHPDFVGLRGSREQVNGLEDALGLPRSVVDPGESPEEYFVGHAGQVLAFDGEGVARMAYPWGIRQRDWRRDLPRMVAGEWPEAPDSDPGTESD